MPSAFLSKFYSCSKITTYDLNSNFPPKFCFAEDAVSKGLEVVPGIEFGARHTMDGMFTFIDPKMTTILGYLPQELIGSSVYEHVLYDDIPGLVEGHKRALKVK